MSLEKQQLMEAAQREANAANAARARGEDPSKKNGEPDFVNHPPHYKSGGLEAIDVIEAFDLDFCLGNTVKYVLRAGRKSGESTLRDLKKAEWYLKRRIAQLELKK